MTDRLEILRTKFEELLNRTLTTVADLDGATPENVMEDLIELAETLMQFGDAWVANQLKDQTVNVSASIIDEVETTIRGTWPQIDDIAKKAKGNTLLHGPTYYALEDSIRAKLRIYLHEAKFFKSSGQ